MQDLVRPAIEALSKQVELKTEENRPDVDFWKKYDIDAFLKKTLEKHKKE
jgi:hypothetical protein